MLPSTDERAETLWLETAKEKARIEGPVLCDVGSHLVALGQATLVDQRKRFDVVSKLMDGDEVWVLCKRRDDVVDGAANETYRQPTRPVRELIPSQGYVRLSSVSAPRISVGLGSLMRHPAVVVAILFGMLPGWACAKDYERASSARAAECRSHGRCHVDPTIYWEGLRGVRQILHGQFFSLTAHDQTDCVHSSECMGEGLCHLVGNACTALDDEDCELSIACQSGRCSAYYGSCIVGKDADCKKRPDCREFGFCSVAAEGGHCITAKDEDCRETLGCRERGRCSAGNDSCVARSDADCADSMNCKELGYCTAEFGSCTKSDDECRKAPACREAGMCSAERGYCVAGSATDCEQSQDCADLERCTSSDGECVYDATKSCSDSVACRVHGRCGSTKSFCVARTDQDCAQSSRCRTHGDCKRFGEECAASCEASEACRRAGACTESQGKCVKGSDADCRRSDLCKTDGRCVLIDGFCESTDAECAKTEQCRYEGKCSASEGGIGCSAREPNDCKGAEVCREEGACTVQKGVCRRTSDEDCAATSACETDGKCTFVGTAFSSSCELGPNDCKRLPACKNVGACSISQDNVTCEARTDHDCAESAVCKKFGWCTAVNGQCFTPRAAH